MYKFGDAIKNKVHLVIEEKAKAKPRMDFLVEFIKSFSDEKLGWVIHVNQVL